MLALLRDEPSAEQVERLIDDGASMSSINLGEVLYTLIRTHGDEVADKLVEGVRHAVGIVDADWRLVEEAARIKAGGGLSYADAFCLAAAQQQAATVVTGDPELVALAGAVRVLDLRGGDPDKECRGDAGNGEQ